MPQGPQRPALREGVKPWTRRSDRRRAFHEFLAFLAAGLQASGPRVLLRERFEQGVRRLIAAREVAVRVDGAAEARRTTRHYVSVSIPRAGHGPAARIEALADEGDGFDDWDRQLLRAVRYLGALVLALDEYRERDAAGLTGLVPLRTTDPAMLVGSSAAIRQVRERIARVAATDFTVLIEGESGTGKELVARQIHDLSRRRHGPFVAINCAALVESLLEAELFGIEDHTATGVRGRRGKIEHADRGTLFLDEVSDLSMTAQAKLLRAIQDMAVERVGGHGARRVDIRLIVATNRSLLELVERGLFRLDLFYRLNGVEVIVPPLRERREDILELAECFLARYREARPLQLSTAARDVLLAYHWPGNVRELERVIERAVALARSGEIGVEDLPPALAGAYAEVVLPAARRNDTIRTWASRYARLVFERSGRNKRKACQILGISYHTLRAYLRYGLPDPDGEAAARRPAKGGAATREAVEARRREARASEAQSEPTDASRDASGDEPSR
jgi:DNA-binding NtrC family response regulator